MSAQEIKLPSFEEAAMLKSQQRVEAIVQAIFFHINKHKAHPGEVAYAIASCFKMVEHQLPTEARAEYVKLFQGLLQTGEEKPLIISASEPPK